MGALRSASAPDLLSPRRQKALRAAEARVMAAQVALAASPSPLAQLDRISGRHQRRCDQQSQ
jgi:hypothetical protein